LSCKEKIKELNNSHDLIKVERDIMIRKYNNLNQSFEEYNQKLNQYCQNFENTNTSLNRELESSNAARINLREELKYWMRKNRHKAVGLYF
jgi:vacuolar-type H+-ATPase subunit D/Vma8